MLQQPLVLQPSEQFAWMPRGRGEVCSPLTDLTNNSALYSLALYKRSCSISPILFGGQDSFVLTCSPSTLRFIWKMQTVVRWCKHDMLCAFVLKLYAAACKHAKESELAKLSFKSLLSAICLHPCSTGATTEPM